MATVTRDFDTHHALEDHFSYAERMRMMQDDMHAGEVVPGLLFTLILLGLTTTCIGILLIL